MKMRADGTTPRTRYELHLVVQDMLIPASTLSESMTVMDKYFDVYPVWICPMRIFKEVPP